VGDKGEPRLGVPTGDGATGKSFSSPFRTRTQGSMDPVALQLPTASLGAGRPVGPLCDFRQTWFATPSPIISQRRHRRWQPSRRMLWTMRAIGTSKPSGLSVT